MGLKRALAAVAGGQRSLLQTTPADELRYAAMGGVIVSTALVAAASAAMAVHMALRMPIALAVMVGVVWGFIIFNLDRLLVVQMMRQKNKWMTAVMAVPRVMLALVLGAVISTPVVLQIFGPEIKTELGVLHAERIAEYNRNTANNPDYASIPALEKSVADDEKIVAGGVALNVEMDPAVVEVRKQYDAAQARFEQAQKNVVCEKEGTCGSGNPGAGIAYDEKLRIQAEARRTRDEVLRRLDTARATAQAAQQTAQSEAAAAARGRLEQNQKRLAALKAQLDADKKAHEADSKKDTGLLARLEALDELSADRPTLRTAHITLFLLFLALELLPVLMKVLQLVGPETDYDKVTREHSDHLLQTGPGAAGYGAEGRAGPAAANSRRGDRQQPGRGGRADHGDDQGARGVAAIRGRAGRQRPAEVAAAGAVVRCPVASVRVSAGGRPAVTARAGGDDARSVALAGAAGHQRRPIRHLPLRPRNVGLASRGSRAGHTVDRHRWSADQKRG